MNVRRFASQLAAVALASSALAGWSGARAQTAAPAGNFQWQALGERTFDNNCSGCHQRSGAGIPGGFPPLAGHAPEIFAQKGGAYMVRVLLFGLGGAIDVNGTKYNGNMPSWDQLKDEEIAAVLDHVLTAWSNDQHLPKDFKPILPSDFTAAQAERGHLTYAHNCLDCHGSNLDNGEFGGPPLKGLSFARHWEATNVA